VRRTLESDNRVGIKSEADLAAIEGGLGEMHTMCFINDDNLVSQVNPQGFSGGLLQ